MKSGVVSQRWFLVMLGFSVALLSFVYGLTVGLKRPHQWASAKADIWEAPLDGAQELAMLAELGLPANVELSRLGRNTILNGRAATMVSFSTDIPFSRILNEQEQFWQTSGFKVVSRRGSHRGVLVGYDAAQGRKLIVSVWTVPPIMRQQLSQGKPVLGMLSLLSGDPANALSSSDVLLVPDVPLVSGGKGGAVLQSEDIQGQTYSSVYTVPLSNESAMDYYRREMGSGGWLEMDTKFSDEQIAGGHLYFVKEEDEVMLLFTPKNFSSESRSFKGASSEETVIAVFRGPRMDMKRFGERAGR